MGNKDNILTFKINTDESVNVKELSESLLAIHDLYIKELGDENCSVKISEVRHGSFEFDFTLIMLSIIPLMENVNIVSDFIGKIQKLYNFFLSTKNTQNVTDLPLREDVENINKMVQPIININGGNPTINIYGRDNKSCNISISQNEAKTISENGKIFIQQQESIKNQELEKILTFQDQIINFQQTRSDNKKGTKAICSEIYKKEVDVDFEIDFIKNNILHKDYNPYSFLYVVDLRVEFKNEIPKKYTIIALKNMRNKDTGLFDE